MPEKRVAKTITICNLNSGVPMLTFRGCYDVELNGNFSITWLDAENRQQKIVFGAAIVHVGEIPLKEMDVFPNFIQP